MRAKTNDRGVGAHPVESRNQTYNQQKYSKVLRHSQQIIPPRLDFQSINIAALDNLRALLADWLPEGRIQGQEYVALNPTRQDRHLGSFKININTGRWADFATGDRGGDVVSLLAYLAGISQGQAARMLTEILGVHHG